jgi:hypothetical protein
VIVYTSSTTVGEVDARQSCRRLMNAAGLPNYWSMDLGRSA